MPEPQRPRAFRVHHPQVDPARPQPGRLALAYGRLVTRARYWIVLGWLLVTVAFVFVIPAGHGGAQADIEGFIPSDLPAIQTEIRSVQTFGFPLFSRTVLVQRDPDGLSSFTQAEAVLRAVALTRGQYEGTAPILGALPIINALEWFPSSNENGTTALTYFFLRPTEGFAVQQASAERFARRFLDADDHFVGVTGSVPARVEQGRVIDRSLGTMELATLAAIVTIVAVNFRSPVAAALTLVTAGVAFVVTLRVAAIAGQTLGIPIPTDLEPLMFALLLGVVTDYAIFYLSGFRHRLAEGDAPPDAAIHASSYYGPIIAVAGITVAAGTASMLVAESPLFRAFGPSMALSILVGLVVAMTLVPAVIAVLGPRVFWPSRLAQIPDEMPGPAPTRLVSRLHQNRLIGILINRRGAAMVFLGTVAVLVIASLPLLGLNLGVSFVPSLPDDNEVRRAADAAEAGFAPGILSPTTILVEGERVGDRPVALARLTDAIAAVPGVAGVLGPGDLPLPARLGILTSQRGDAARYLVVLDDEPLGAQAIDTLEVLRDQFPGMLRETGLDGVRYGFAGDTAIAESIVDRTGTDLRRIVVAALAVNLVMLIVFLRAVIAPICLLATSALSLCATLGLTVALFQGVLGRGEVTFYVPLAVGVLLLALGSDYNIFGVGHVWEEARVRPLREAIAVAIPQSTRAITAAGITLAVSFGLLVLVPLRTFRELGFAMFVGILLDAIVVRTLLMPAMLTLLGRWSAWPSSRLKPAPAPVEEADRPLSAA